MITVKGQDANQGRRRPIFIRSTDDDAGGLGGPGFRPTGTFVRGATLAIGLIALGCALRRPDVVALAAPFVLAPILYGHRRDTAPTVDLDLGTAEGREGQTLGARIRLTSTTECDLVVITLDASDVDPVGGRRAWVVAIGPDEVHDLGVELRPRAWGRQNIGPVHAVAWAASLVGASDVITSRTIPIQVVPDTDVFAAPGLIPNTLGYSGSHRSAAVGPGTEIATVRPFAPGDRIRRVHWRSTLRTGELHVTTTTTERSSEVVIVIEAVEDAGPPGGSILDLTARAAGAIAQHYLTAGDVVRLEEVGAIERRLGRLAGSREMERVRTWLMDLRSVATNTRAGAVHEWLPGQRVSGKLVICLSPMLSEHAPQQAAALRAHGAAVAVIDTLGPEVTPPVHDEVEAVASAIWSLERDEIVGRLGEVGVATVRWEGPGSLDIVLRDLTRMAAAPKDTRR